MRHYVLKCQVCGNIIHDDSGIIINCNCPNFANGLLTTIYNKQKLELLPHPGILKYANWLPVNLDNIHKLDNINIHPLAIRDEKLGHQIGLTRLTIVFNGFWPEKNTYYSTCTFKELEALTVLGRIESTDNNTLVVASAGNTARAFYHYCTIYNIQALIIVPQTALSELWTTLPYSNSVRLITLDKHQDYTDAIRLAESIKEIPGFFIEGGVRNVARRDGLGTVLLSGVQQNRQLPDHYFQAVGSGTGAVAVWEMSKRLIQDGRFGNYLPKMHLSQNKPFTPLTLAWNAQKKTLGQLDSIKAKKQINKLYAQVLSNRNPPYSLKGGLYEALKDTNSEMYSISRSQALSAAKIFNKIHNCDLDPAAAVAFASLLKAIQNRTINQNDLVFLNLTGGGRTKVNRAKKRLIKPDLIINTKDLTHTSLQLTLTKLTKCLQKV